MKNKNIKSIPIEDRPREKLLKYGKDNLTLSELVAIVIKSGIVDKNVIEVSQEVVKKIECFKDLRINELTKIDGIGPVKAIEIIAAVELGKRINNTKKNIITNIKKPDAAYDYMKQHILGLKQEHFFCIFLDVKGNVTSHKLLFIGSLSETLVHPREIFKEAVKVSANSIILVHNHPSGNTNPSKEDIIITKRISELGKLMDISILDHIIMSDYEFTSMKQLELF